MPKRVSLKGKGADIFFGDFTPTASATPSTAASEQVEVPVSPTPSQNRAKPSSRSHRREDASVRARTHARTDADVGARVRTAMRAELLKKLRQKQRLASYTFRFRPEELDRLDQVVSALESGNGQRPSKNDLVRLGLLWLLADYEDNGDASVLAQVLARS
jgi:hypothetical protein